MKILHTADLHLKEYADERWQTLEKIFDVARQEKIDLLIISGDLFDKNYEADNLRPKIRKVFSKNGFKILIIPGNHDQDSYPSGFYFGEDVQILRDIKEPFVTQHLKVWGFPFEAIDGKEILYRLHLLSENLRENKKNILLYHGELLDAFFSRNDFGDEGRERYMPLRISYFNNLKLDYVLAGHFHSKFEVFRLKEGGYFVYPGSPISITKRETGKRCVNIFELGEPPQRYHLQTPYYEEAIIAFEPKKKINPLEEVEKRLNQLEPEAKIILRVKGFIDGEALGTNEEKLTTQIKELTAEKCIEQNFEFKDISKIMADDLWLSFREKMEFSDWDDEVKKKMQEVTLQAFVGCQK